jgi:hypothetical protein
MKNQEINLQEIKDEMKQFYDLTVTEEVIEEWIGWYHYDRIEDDEDYDGIFCFDTSEREDLYIHLKEEGLI